jgi:hypothetical protein
MKRFIFIIITVLLFSSCSSDSANSYVDVEKTNERINVEKNNEENINIDDKAKIFLSNCSIASNHIILCEQDNKKRIDLNTGEISSLCDIPGCAHDINNSKGCIEFQPLNNLICSSQGIYYTNYSEPGKLHYKTDNEDKVVYENSFFTEKEKEIDPDAKTAFSMFVRDDKMYIVGQVYFYTVDLKTFKQTCEPVVITDSPIWNADVYDEYFYITNENLELIRYDMKNRKKEKMSDKVWRIQANSKGLYYIKSDGEQQSLFFTKNGEKSETKLIPDVGLNMYVTESNIYYTSKDGIYKSDPEGKNAVKIELSLTYDNGEKYNLQDSRDIQLITCPSSAHIYLLDYKKTTGEKCYNALFSIDKKTNDCKAISLGIWYQPIGGNEEILSY